MTATLHHESYFRGLLESLYSGLTDLDTQGYQQLGSDTWKQARMTGDQFEHLEVKVDIGGIEEFTRDDIAYGSSLAFVCRMQPENDSRSQARLQAAVRAVFEFLIAWRHHDARAMPLSSSVLTDEAGPEWALVEIPFQLRIPRG